MPLVHAPAVGPQLRARRDVRRQLRLSLGAEPVDGRTTSTRKAQASRRSSASRPGDVVLDIGSNDGTLLGSYSTERRSAVSASIRRRQGSRTFYPPRRRARPGLLLRRRRSERSSERASARRSPRSPCSTTSRTRSHSRGTFATASRRDGVWHFEQSLHAVDAALDRLRHGLPRAPGVLLARHRPPDPRARPGSSSSTSASTG